MPISVFNVWTPEKCNKRSMSSSSYRFDIVLTDTQVNTEAGLEGVLKQDDVTENISTVILMKSFQVTSKITKKSGESE
jgi:hypothetical protein